MVTYGISFLWVRLNDKSDSKILLSAKNGDETCNRTNFNELRCIVKNGAYFSTTSLSSQSKEKGL